MVSHMVSCQRQKSKLHEYVLVGAQGGKVLLCAKKWFLDQLLVHLSRRRGRC